MDDRNRTTLFSYRIFSLILFLLIAHPASAQIEELVVTAQKRAEDIQDVPISISAFSGDFMEESGVDTLQDLSFYTPNLTLTQSSQVANNRIIMRGVGSVGNNAIEPSVAVFIDGVYYPRPSSVVGSLTDLEMVEVLRGPQGTLFGRNASMGALNIRTRKPTDEFEGSIRGSIGNYDDIRVSGYVNGGLTANTAGRLSFHLTDRNGYGDNTFTAYGNDENVGDWQDYTVRGKLYFEPTADLNVTLTADYAKVNNGGPVVEVKADTVLPTYGPLISSILSPTGPFAPTGPVPDLTNTFDYVINQDHRDHAEDRQHGIAADVNWTVGEHTIRSITAYRDWNNDTFESALRLPADLLNRVTSYDVQTVSQELQLISPAGERLEYVAGFYYYNEDYSIDQRFDLGADFCSPAFGNLAAAQTAQNGTAQAVAIASVTAALTGAGLPAALAGTVATGLVTGTITTVAQLTGLGVPAPLAPAILASASPATVLTAATAIGSAASAQCAAGAQTAAIDTQFNQNLTSIALFGQLTFNVTDQLKMTGGVRWTRDDKDGSFISIINNPVIAPASLVNPFGIDLRVAENTPNLKYTESKVTWLGNISYYLTDDIMTFFTYSTGFKSGGFNSEGFNSIGIANGAGRVFGSETVDNYEFGVKSSWFDNRMVANINYFHTNLSGFQDRQFDGVNFFVQNAGELTQQGIELDVMARPVERLYTTVGLSYLDSEFDSFPNATNLPAVVAATQATNRALALAGFPPVAVPPRDLAGYSNHFSPEWQFSAVAEWEDVLRNTTMSWFLRGEYQLVGKQNIGAETNQNPQTLQESYDIVNARLGLRGADDKWELTTFVRNAFDTGYCQTMFNQPIGTTLGLVDQSGATLGGMQRCVVGTPRTWGVEAAYRF